MSAIDKLDEARRDKVKKMSDVRLVAKLGQLGFSPEQLETMDRPALMNAMSQLILTGKDVAPPAAAATPVQPPLYDVELERSKLAWEKERFAAEHAFREAQERRIADEKAAEQAFREAQERRIADEKAADLQRIAEEKAIESERFAIEQDRLARDRALREEEIRLRSRELARRVEESERPAVRVKLFGDAMRNSAITM